MAPRLVVLVVIVAFSVAGLILRPGGFLKFVASVFFSPISPLGRGALPGWVRYYRGESVFEGKPSLVDQMEEAVRIVGYSLLAVPLVLIVLAVLLGD